jgi:Trk K+ transport system NAD-binding subunit
VIIFGLGRFGAAIAMRLHRHGLPVLGIDFNPQAVRRCNGFGIDTRYGDATDSELIADLPLAEAQWLVSTTPNHAAGLTHDDTRIILIQLARSTGFTGRIAVTSHSGDESEALLEMGADLVIEPFQDAADRAVELLSGARLEERIEIPPIETEQQPIP